MLSSKFEEAAIIEKEVLQLNLKDLNALRSSLSSRVEHLQNEISDLAFNNYRTYADAGRTAEHSKEMFSSISKYTSEIKHDLPGLMENIEKFHENSNTILKESDTIEDIMDRSCPIWELLQLPKVMEKCIRAGQYESAYALTNFALSIKQSKLVKYPLIKHVVEVLIEARHGLLDELFNKFAGPIDLAKSIQVVNNIRKIPYISNTQLRVSILQYRDVYLEKQIMSIMSEPDFLLKVIEVYRDCMYDTMVLYLAVFPETDLQRRYTMSDDPRWERWTGSSQSFLLQSWAHRNIDRLFDFLRSSESKSSLDIEAMSGKFMSFALSFGRMGMDFRILILNEFQNIILDLFKKKVDVAVKNLTSLKKLSLIDGDIFENTRQDLELTNGTSKQDLPLSAPLELCVWDDLCVFGNEIIESLNDMRHTMAVCQVNDMFRTLQNALQKVTKWIDGFFKTDDILVTKRAIKLYLTHFIPFINRCFLICFSYETCFRPYFRGSESLQDYENTYDLLSRHLFELCEHDDTFETIFKEVIESRQTRPPVFRIESPVQNGTIEKEEAQNESQQQLTNETERRSGSPLTLGNGENNSSISNRRTPVSEHLRSSPNPIDINDSSEQKSD